MLAALMIRITPDSTGSSPMSITPDIPRNGPRTLAIIMCRAMNSTCECEGSMTHRPAGGTLWPSTVRDGAVFKPIVAGSRHRDAADLAVPPLGDLQDKDAVVERGVDAALVDLVRQLDLEAETAHDAFAATQDAGPLLLLALARDRHPAAGDGDVDVVALHARELDFDHVAVLGLLEIGDGD